LLIGELLEGKTFEAHAKPFAEFALTFGKDEILRLRYAFDAEVEALGGISYQCDYNSRRWELQFFRTPYLQRESYRLLREGNLAVSTDVMRVLRSVDVTYSDGLIWRCHTGLLGTVVTDAAGNRVLHTSPRMGLVLGGSSIQIDGAQDHERVLPLLIILLHSTTHTRR
jgi:hypothetical protein